MRVKPRLEYKEGREMFDRPDGVVDCCSEIDGVMRTWKEYVPTGYTGISPVPLVITLHGGSSKKGNNNQRAELSTAWASVAERENFIVVYPQSLTPEHTWTAWEDFSDEERMKDLKDDIRYLDILLELIQKKYKIDKERRYLHGQSFGDVMATYYLLNQPNHPFAAAATLSGPVGAGRLFDADGGYKFGSECAVPVVRTHGSLDLAIPLGNYQHMEDSVRTFDLMREIKEKNLDIDLRQAKMELHLIPCVELWKYCNGCQDLPLLSVRGRYNVATYPGEQDFHFYMVEKGGHGPSMDMADFIWTCFFSGYKRVDGRYVKTQPQVQFVPDENAVVVAAGASKTYVNNQIVELGEEVRLIDGNFYVPYPCVEKIYPNLTVTLEYEGAGAVITNGAEYMQVSASNQTFVWCDHLQHGIRTRMDGETLLIPIAQVGAYFYEQKIKTGYDIAYLSETDGQITYDFAYLVRQILGTEKILTTKEMWDREADILKDAVQPG